MDQEKMRDRYIGNIYAKDMYDFCQMSFFSFDDKIPFWERENDFVSKVRKNVEGERIFHFPAAFFGSLWLVYHGIMKRALIFDAIWIVLFELVFSDLVAGVAGIIFILLFGFRGMNWYYKHVQEAVAKRGLLMRSPEDSEELANSLSKEGKPSLKRAVIYMLLRALLITCCNDIVLSFALRNL